MRCFVVICWPYRPSVRHGCWGCRSRTYPLLQKLSNVLPVLRYRWSQIAQICAETVGMFRNSPRTSNAASQLAPVFCVCARLGAAYRQSQLSILEEKEMEKRESRSPNPRSPLPRYSNLASGAYSKKKASSTPTECWQCISDPCVGIVPQAVCWNFVSRAIWNSVRSAKVLLV